MPLAGPLRAWIAKCKAYAAEHGCSYKDAMSALGGKGKKSHRRKSHRGGNGVADSAAEYNGGNTVEGAANMTGPPPAPSTDSPAAPADGADSHGQSGGGMASAFEVGGMTGMGGGRRRRRGSKCRGSKRRGSKRRRSKRGGALSYSEF